MKMRVEQIVPDRPSDTGRYGTGRYVPIVALILGIRVVLGHVFGGKETQSTVGAVDISTNTLCASCTGICNSVNHVDTYDQITME